MPNITTTELANSIATIVSAQVLGYLKSNTVLAGLVNRDYENEVAQHGQTVQIPAAGTLVANDKAQNATVTRQNPSDSKVDVVLNNHKEITFMIEDFAKILARPDWVATYMSQSINVMAEAVDAAIAGLYSGFSQTIDATAGLSEVHFRQARRLLNSAKAPMRQRYAVLHEMPKASSWPSTKPSTVTTPARSAAATRPPRAAACSTALASIWTKTSQW
jgi:hypothetical protein